MVLWRIAVKNFKSLANNYLLLALLIIMPLMQIYMLKLMTGNVALQGELGQGGLVELISLSTTAENILPVLSAGILVQFLLIAGMIAGSTMVGEREQNTMLRLLAAPISKSKMLGGMLLGHATTIFMVATVIIGISKVFLDVPWGESWINIFIVTLMAVYVAIAMAFVISGIFPNPKIAGGIMSLVVIGMTFASGSLIQSDKLETISKFTINKWIFESYSKLAQGASFQDISFNLLVLLLIGTTLMLLASYLYRRENIYE